MRWSMRGFVRTEQKQGSASVSPPAQGVHVTAAFSLQRVVSLVLLRHPAGAGEELIRVSMS